MKTRIVRIGTKVEKLVQYKGTWVTVDTYFRLTRRTILV